MDRVNALMSKLIDQPANLIASAFAGTAVWGAFTQESITTIAAAGMAVAVVIGKLTAELADKRRAARVADAEAQLRTDAAAAEAKLKSDMAELEARRKADQDGVLSWKKMVADEAQEKIDAQTELASVKIELASVRSQLAKVTQSQNEVLTAVNKQSRQVKETVKRVTAVEKAAGSTSGHEIPTSDPSTAVDLPILDGK